MPKPGAVFAAIAALLLAPAHAANPPAAAAPDNALIEGQVFSSANAIVIGGWKKLWTTEYVTRRMAERVTTETPQCCVNVFGKGKALLVVKSEAVSRDASGDPLTERIQRKLWITQRADEITADCQIVWISPALSLVDVKTDAIRSVVVDENGELAIFDWRNSGSHCAFGD